MACGTLRIGDSNLQGILTTCVVNPREARIPAFGTGTFFPSRDPGHSQRRSVVHFEWQLRRSDDIPVEPSPNYDDSPRPPQYTPGPPPFYERRDPRRPRRSFLSLFRGTNEGSSSDARQSGQDGPWGGGCA